MIGEVLSARAPKYSEEYSRKGVSGMAGEGSAERALIFWEFR